ncbi:MAG: hypothetical protein JWM80_140, partial [Cyanobacteria bacterium RYN_339]|nr:hypothetical protein [Cyanobacteria bacterium RYN_339]
MPNQSHRTLALVLALALLAACKTTPVLAPTGDGTVSSERGGAKLSVAGHVFAMRTLDGKSLDTLDLQIGDLIFHTKDGKLTLPEGALAAIRARGAFLVRAPGYVPRKVAFDGQGDVALVPVGPTLASGSIPPAGGHLGGGSVSLDLPLGMLAQPATVTVHPYQVPAGDLNAPGAAQERAAVLAATGHPDQGCDHPLPCPPPTSAIGLLIDVDGHLNDGTLAVSYDLAALAREGNQAAVDRLRATFAAIDA